MPLDSEHNEDFRTRVILLIAGFFFILQFFVLAYNFNFHGVVIFTIIGWILLVPGFLLISTSHSSMESHTVNQGKAKHFIHSLTPHPLLDGWLLMSIALALISQHLLCFIFMGVQLPLIIYEIYRA